MNHSTFHRPIPPQILEQAVTDIVNAVATEEAALANILKLERDIIQRAKNDAADLEEFVAVNESVDNIIRNIAKVQMITQMKLKNLKGLILKIADLNENDASEEEL